MAPATSRQRIIVILLIIAVTGAVYCQTLGFDFIRLDDPKYVTDNPMVKQGLTVAGVKWALTSFYASNWHPLTWISHMLDVELFGLEPGMHHFINLVFHILNSILLLLILESMTGKLWRSAAVAALFALHPLHVESVAWISERKDVLSTFFWMLTLAGYLWYVKKKGALRYLAVVLAFTLGLFSKPMLVTLPFVLLLLDFWPLNRWEPFRDAPADGGQGEPGAGQGAGGERASALILEKTPLFFLSALSCLLTFAVQKFTGAVRPLEMFSFAYRLENAAVSYVSYLLKTAWPFHLAPYYPFREAINPAAAGACALLLLLVTLCVIAWARKAPWLTVGWLWFLGTLVPVIGLVQVGLQSMADRYSYVPLIGIFIMISWGLAGLFARYRWRMDVLGSAAATALVVLALITWLQVGWWKDSLTLFTRTLAVTSRNFTIHYNLGVVLSDKGDVDGAVKQYSEAVRINPGFAQAHNNLGTLLLLKGDSNGAITHFMKSLMVNPRQPEALNNLGAAFMKKGDLASATECFGMVLKENPGYAPALRNLAIIRSMQGEKGKE